MPEHETERRQDQGVDQGREARSRLRDRRQLWLLVLLAILALGWAGRWAHNRWTHVYIEDARVDGEVVTISSRVAGWVTALPVIEGDAVKAGGLLVKIDDRDSRLQREVLGAKLKALEHQMAVVRARAGQVDEETLGRYKSELNRLAAAEAEVAALEVQVKQARDDYERARDLAQQKWLSPQAMERARTAWLQVQESHRKAQAEVAAVRGTLAAAGGSRREVVVMARQLEVLQRQADEIRAEAKRADNDIADRTITAPRDGRVVMTFVRQGEHVSAGQRILMFHDPRQIWVEANVRETDVARLRAGQNVTIRVDAYPGETFSGKVFRIGQTATSKFALLPDPNPSGNFTKITQRLPVRILLDGAHDGRSLRPGMMVEVYVDVHDD